MEVQLSWESATLTRQMSQVQTLHSVPICHLRNDLVGRKVPHVQYEKHSGLFTMQKGYKKLNIIYPQQSSGRTTDCDSVCGSSILPQGSSAKNIPPRGAEWVMLNVLILKYVGTCTKAGDEVSKISCGGFDSQLSMPKIKNQKFDFYKKILYSIYTIKK